MDEANFYDLTEQLAKKLYEPIDDSQSLNEWKRQMSILIDDISQLKLAMSKSKENMNTSLDPTDWLITSSIAQQMLNSSLKFIRQRHQQPVWQSIPYEIRSSIENEPLPECGQPLSQVYHDATVKVLPYSRGNTHARFWGWAMGEGTVGGILADMIAATLNINAGACTHSATFIERRVIQWMRQIFGFPSADHGGTIVSGTSMATIICLATARQQRISNVRQDGIIDGPHLVIYASVETHMCIKRAAELLGFGSKAIHTIPVDDHFRMNIDELRLAIEDDRKQGLVPFCIVGNAGSWRQHLFIS
jgi:aromatic-L-amino-acid/L-tryptophan decarboxylase